MDSTKSLPNHEGKLVRFTNPTTGKKAKGKILKEVCVLGGGDFIHDGWRQAAFYAQLVDWGGGKRIRFCYYVRKKDEPSKWRFSRYAPSMSVEECRELLEKIHDAPWLS